MFENIIRGGQLLLHAIRMFRQVFKFLFCIIFVIGIVIYLVKAYYTISAAEMWAAYDYYRARFLIIFFMKTMKLQTHYFNIMAEFEASSIPLVPYFIIRKDEFLGKLVYCFYFTGKIIGGLFVVLTVILVRKGLKKSGVKFNRGAKIERFDEIKQTITSHNKARKYSAYSLGGIPYPYYSEMEHTLVTGSTGVGKTVLISELVEQIRKRGDKAIIYDKKGDYIEWFYDKSKDYILNPFDTRGSNWNLLAEIEHIAHLKPLSQAFIPDSRNQGDKIWDEAGRIAFSSILEKFVLAGEELTNQEIVDKILKQDTSAIEALVKGTYAQSLIDTKSPRTTASVLFVLANYLNSLRLTKGTRENSFSIRRWLREEKKDSILFISSQQSLDSALSPLITAWFEIGINGILSLPQSLDRKTWVILDELPALNRIPSLPQGLSVARSYGGCFVLGIQNIAQMREIYGSNITEVISSECNTRCIFKTNDPDTARWLVRNLGDEDISEFKEGLSYGAHAMRDGISVNENNRIRSLILPSEIQHMKKLSLLIKMPDYPAAKAKIKYKERKQLNKAFINEDTVSTRLQEVNEITGLNIVPDSVATDDDDTDSEGKKEVFVKKEKDSKAEQQENIKESNNNKFNPEQENHLI